ncbi:MAG: hypothetical protein COV45_04345 [Deltaproteobacteria bacterium CG11_big_fil_rev_8_21_14_0_20_47_16]|nr:MAG: hypothetical protein COV45_04345 [Deltaproteobacteria bacterium CG11_big_fil_rev_8_21_14_0_20_47_16]
MTTEKQKLASSLKSHLQFQQSMGIQGIPTYNTVQGSSATTPIHAGESLDDIRNDVGDCQRCKLCSTRTNIVFGVGNPHAELMFIGEGPGADEDAQGEPFVGRAGKLLTKIIEAMGLQRSDVYINNIVMCRPPNNRAPEPDESATCKPFLLRRIAVIKPKLIVCLGATAVKNLLEVDTPISKIRGKIQDWQGYKVMPTFHPAFLLRNPNMKKPVWEDMKVVLEFLGKPVPEKNG